MRLRTMTFAVWREMLSKCSISMLVKALGDQREVGQTGCADDLLPETTAELGS